MGRVAAVDEDSRGLGLVGEFFADTEFPYVDRLAEGEGFS